AAPGHLLGRLDGPLLAVPALAVRPRLRLGRMAQDAPVEAVLLRLGDLALGPAALADGALGGGLEEHEVADVELEVRDAVIVRLGGLAKPDADEKIVHGFHSMPPAGRAGSAELRGGD